MRSAARLEALEDRRVLASILINGGESSSWNVNDIFTTDNGLPAGGIGTSAPAGQGASVSDASSDGGGDAFDGGAMFWVDDTQVVGTLTQNGQTVSFAPSTISALDVQLEYYFDPNSATQRSYLSLMNPTGSSITVDIDYATNFGSDSSTQVESTSSGDTTFTTADRWIVTSDGGSSDPVNTTVISGPGSPDVVPSAVSQTVYSSSGTEGVLASYSITVPAGASRGLLTFQQLDDTVADANNEAMDFDTTPIPADFTAGLTNGQLSQVVNFDFPIVVDTTADLVDGDTSSLTALEADRGTDDSVSLREYIQAANNTPGDDTVEFNPSLAGNPITLTMGQLDITDDLTINGLGADQLTISGGGASRLFSSQTVGQTFTVNDLTLSGGNAMGGSGGVIIQNSGTVNFNRVVMSGNTATTTGSAIDAAFGTLNIVDSAIVNNFGAGPVAAVRLQDHTTTITNSTISGNMSQGINLFSPNNTPDSLSLTNVTIADNQDEGVRLISNNAMPTTFEYQNSIFADNGGGSITAGGNEVAAITITSLGTNILDDTPTGDATHAAGPFDQRDTDPLIGSLEENMGTFVHPLLSSSPAIDAADNGTAPSTDQRGVARADGNNNSVVTADIGAFEFSPFFYQIATVDDITLLYDSGSDEVRVVETGNQANILEAIDKDDIDSLVFITGDPDDNTLTVDPSYYQLDLDVQYDGGAEANDPDGDRVIVRGSGSQDAVYTPDVSVPVGQQNAGTITVTDGAATSVISFTGLEPGEIENMATATYDPPGDDDVITISEGMTMAGDDALVVSGTTGGMAFETGIFRNIGVLTIDTTTDDGDDTINIDSGANDHGITDLEILTGTGTDVVNLNGDLDLDLGPNTSPDGNEDLRIETQQINLGDGTGIDTITVGDTVSLDAGEGSIVDGMFHTINAVNLVMDATTGIGDASTDAGDIDGNITNLAARTVTGDIHFEDLDGTLNIVDLDLLGGGDTIDGVDITTGAVGDDILIRSRDAAGGNDLSVENGVSNAGAGDIILVNEGAITEDDNLLLEADIEANGGAIRLISEEDVVFSLANVTVSNTAEGTINVHAGQAFDFAAADRLGATFVNPEADIFSNAGNYFLTTEDGDILTTATDNVAIGQYNADSDNDRTGDIAADMMNPDIGNVTVIADADENDDGNISDSFTGEAAAGDATNANIIGNTVRLRAATGIGSDTGMLDEDADIDLDAVALAATNSTSDFIQLFEVNNLGILDDVIAGDDNDRIENDGRRVVLDAGGTITDKDSADDTNANVVAAEWIVRAQTGIGAADMTDATTDNQDIDTEITDLAATTASGDISISDDGDLNLTTVGNLTGVAITAATTGDDILIRNGAAGATDFDVEAEVSINATGDGHITLINNDTGELDVNANVTNNGTGNVELYSAGEVNLDAAVTVSTTTGDVEIHAGRSVDYFTGVQASVGTTANVTMQDGSTVETAGGNVLLTAPDDVELSIVDADTGTVYVIADVDQDTDGAILDNTAAEDPNITAAATSLSAGSGIGTADMMVAATDDTDIDTAVTDLAATTLTGDISISNEIATANFNITAVAGMAFRKFGTPTTVTGVSITASTDGDDILIRSNQSAGSTTDFNVLEEVSISGAAATGHITLINYDETPFNIDADVTNNGTGNIELFSDGDVDLGTGVDITTNGGDMEIHAGTTTTYFAPATLTTDTDEYDLLVDTTSTIASNDGDILLTATGDVELATVDAGAGTVYVIADLDEEGEGMIIDDLDSEDANITADSASLRAGNGIGVVDMATAATDDQDIDTSVVDLAATTVSGDISISNEITTADFNITEVLGTTFRKFGDVDDLAGVTITDGTADDDILIRSNQSVGSTTEFNVLEEVSISGAAATGHITLINYDETPLDVDVNITNNGTGNIELFSGGDVDLGTGVDITTNGGDMEIHAGTTTTYFAPATLTTDTDEYDLLVDTTTTITSNDGNILLTATGNVELSTVDAGAGNVYVIADLDEEGEGAIVDDLATEDANITADSASLRAGNGIGTVDMMVAATDDMDIDTSVVDLAATTVSGDISISNEITTADFNITEVLGADFRKFGMVDDLAGVTITDGTADDDILIRSNQSAGSTTEFNVLSEVSISGAAATGHITLLNYDETPLDVDADITNNGTGNVELYSAGEVNLDPAVTVSTTTGDVEIHAGRSVDYFTGVQASVGTTANVTMQDGSTVETDGGNVLLTAVNDVMLSTVDADTGNVYVIADLDDDMTGAIADNTTAEAANLIATAASLSAGSGIGDADMPNPATDVLDIDTEITDLAATTDMGDISVSDDGDLNIAEVVGMAFRKFGTPATVTGVTITAAAAGDDILIRNGDAGATDFDVEQEVSISATGDGSITLINNDTGELDLNANLTNFGTGNVELYSRGDVNLDAAVTVSTTTGNVEIHAGRFVDYFNATGTQGTAGTTADLVMQDGSAVQTIGGNVLLTAVDDVQLSMVNAGAGNVYVIADTDDDGEGMISDNTAAENANLVAAAASLRAGDGIGVAEMTIPATDDQDIDTSITDLAATTDSGDISISDDGDLNITTVTGDTFRKFGAVADLTGVTITAPTGADDILIRNGDAGATDFDVEALVSIAAGGTGSITLINNDTGELDVNADLTNLGTGNVELYSADEVNLDPAVTVSTTTGDVEIHAGRFVDYFDAATTQGTVGITADLVMQDGSTVETDGGNVLLTAVNDVLLSEVDADTGSVYVIADTDEDAQGMIADNTAAEDANLTASAASLRAGDGIGTGNIAAHVACDPQNDSPDTDIDTSIATLAAVTDSGEILIENDNQELTIGTVIMADFRKFGTVGVLGGIEIEDTLDDNSGADDINIVNGTASLTVAADVTNNDGGVVRLRTGDNDTLLAGGGAESFDTGADDDIVLQASVAITSSPTTGSANVYLEAGDDINVPDSVTITAADELTFQVDAIDMGNNDTFGGVLTIEGDMDNIGGTATDITVNLFGNDDNDTLNLDYDRFSNTDLLNVNTCGNEPIAEDSDNGRNIEMGATVGGGMPYNISSPLLVDSNGNPTPMTMPPAEVGDTVNFDDTDEADDHTYELDGDMLTRDGAPDTVFNDMTETLNIEAGMGDDLLLITYPVTPDVVTFDGDGGENQVVVTGTTGDDKITIGDLGAPGTISPRNPIEVTGVGCLQITGGMGDDQLVNNTSISSIIDGQQGDDVIVGGFNDDVLFGGAGVDALFGRAGDDFLFSDENIMGDQFADDGELLDGGLGLGDAADQQGDDFLRQIEFLEDGGGQKTVLMFLRVVIGDVDSDDAFNFIDCFPYLTPGVPEVVLNPNPGADNPDPTVMETPPPFSTVGTDEAAFTFNPANQPGFLTVLADYNQNATVAGSPLRFYVVNERGMGVGASSMESGSDRIDIMLSEPDMQNIDESLPAGMQTPEELREYTVIVYGMNPSIELTITNALTQNSPLTIHGSAGDDVVSVTTGDDAMQIIYNGVPYEFSNDSTESVTFLGNGGMDTFTVDGIASSQFDVHGPGSTTLTGSPTAIHTAGVEVINYLLDGMEQTYYSSELETYNWQNQLDPVDVNASGGVTMTDALLIVSELRRSGVGNISHLDPGAAPTYYDTNGDGDLTLADALMVVAQLRVQNNAAAAAASSSPGESSEGEGDSTNAMVAEGEASGANGYEALLAEQSDDDDLLDTNPLAGDTLDSIADDIAAAWEG